MSLVGDIIMEVRQRIPDAPAVHNPPIILGISSSFQPGGEFGPGSTHTFVATGVTNWGETGNSNYVSITLGPGDNAVTIELAASGTQIQTINFYEAGAGTPLTATADMWSFPFTTPGTSFYTITSQPLTHTALPTRSTAFLPDADGQFIGGFTMFRLLNRALQEMVKIGGGIVDVTGVQTTVNQSMYRLDSPFYTFVNAWFDGYPMDIVPRSFMYLRNSAAGFSGILSYEQDGPQQVIQVWPQSNRTGGSTVLSSPVGPDDSSLSVVDPSGFLSIGLARIDNEVVVFSQVTNGTFTGVLRGMGGTDPAAHSAGAPVIELNLRMSGYRMCRTYNVGDSALTIQVPQAWETPLVLHMLSQVRSMEQDDATAQKLLSDFQAQADKIAKQSRLGRIKPRQIPIWGQNTSDARNVNGIGFGWLIN